MKPTTAMITTKLLPAALLCLLAPLAGCFSPSYPATPFWCTTDAPYCPSGYECALDETAPDPANPDHRLCRKEGGGGGGPGGCLDDDLENPPNDTAQTATNLDSSLQSHPQGVSLYGVEVCTAEDVDYYAFTITAQKRVGVLVQYVRDAGELSADLLDPSLAVIATGAPVGGGLQMEGTLEPQASPYFLRVAAGVGGSKNKYDFSITISDP